MPGPSGSTPVFGFPYLLETDAPDIATAMEDLALAIENRFLLAQTIVGAIVEWDSDTLPTTGTWLFMHGQTVSEGAYPALAGVYPGWVSGGNINLPDSRGKYSIGAALSGDTTGPPTSSTGGSATITLGTGHIPRFASVAVSITDPGHGHGVSDPNHSHNSIAGYEPLVEVGSSKGLATPGDSSASYATSAQTSTTGTGVSVNSSGTGISGSVTFGSATPTPLTIAPPYLALHKIVRAA